MNLLQNRMFTVFVFTLLFQSVQLFAEETPLMTIILLEKSDPMIKTTRTADLLVKWFQDKNLKITVISNTFTEDSFLSARNGSLKHLSKIGCPVESKFVLFYTADLNYLKQSDQSGIYYSKGTADLRILEYPAMTILYTASSPVKGRGDHAVKAVTDAFSVSIQNMIHLLTTDQDKIIQITGKKS